MDVGHATPQAMRAGVLRGDMMEALTKEQGVAQGIVEWHCYTVLDVYQQQGQWFVKLRNPWGNLDDDTPTGAKLDGKADGIVTLPWRMFVSNFQGYAYA
jgi:hypothetical protein